MNSGVIACTARHPVWQHAFDLMVERKGGGRRVVSPRRCACVWHLLAHYQCGNACCCNQGQSVLTHAAADHDIRDTGFSTGELPLGKGPG